MPETALIETISFETQLAWRDWLENNHLAVIQGIWMRIYKKISGISSVTYADALDESLCFGWIDGQKKRYDTESWLQKFTPRRKKSLWSQINIGHIERLKKLEKLSENGRKEVEAAKQDGRWEAAYASSSTAQVPEDFSERLNQYPLAKTAFENLNKSKRYSILFRLHTTKKLETRERYIQKFIRELLG